MGANENPAEINGANKKNDKTQNYSSSIIPKKINKAVAILIVSISLNLLSTPNILFNGTFGNLF
jgi:hypothetical protein